ncbi:nuclear transport factor 2 family protein [Sphingobacterium alkalisoli]|uniref:Nuclear transport factor 2 family protein n=1 Tax=Sphingobacterium alkalisoli TaxID=1874115 RepID=A0A4U0GZL2_9SPHI|nr:nuclear transport factor 2 family protein [Sphingobacterium alkalisoli]TJY64538.1 nuclear transport factor 2 family protein [Sphingobacterium alkalisoli]GGH21101.1 hypothetical protein GCM10011418_26780 [Sphingobacterium alkalisoli]
MEEKNIEIVKELYRSFKEGNDHNIAQLLSHDVRWNQMVGFPGGGRYVGITDVFQRVFAGLHSQWADWQSDTVAFVACDNTVFVKGYYSGIHKISQKTFKVPFIGEYKIEGGMITEFNQFTDTYLIVQATVED